LRIVHLSDIHFWQYAINPLRLLSKRLLGTTSLLFGRAGRFRLERVPELVDRVNSLNADHILITGDLTTTALPAEFRMARAALGALLEDPARVTIIPGNHDRYTLYAHRSRRFEHYFGAFAPAKAYPWLRRLDSGTAILGFDPTRSGISARGKLPASQLIGAPEILAAAGPVARLLVACHYPLGVPPAFEREYLRKPLVNRGAMGHWLRTIGPHIYCCGHVHGAWAYHPGEIPNQLCVNPGAPLLRDKSGELPGFVEITLDGAGVTVDHHGWAGGRWERQSLYRHAGFFPAARSSHR
jgi:hypothetical protein